MKKIIFTLCLWLTVSWLWAQQKSDPQVFTGNTALQEQPISGGQIHIQVGASIHHSNFETADGIIFNTRFPWDVAYFPLTFYEETFDVSKGYYSDKIQLDWTIHNNSTFITRTRVYRRVFSDSNLNDEDNYVAIASLSADTYTYVDNNTQGGLLYEYKVEAEGIFEIDTKYTTYITGIGYRNPTGVVTGNVSFDGGSPVKDVVIRADPQGGDLALGASLSFAASGYVIMPLRNKELNDKITVQAWVKLDEGQSATLFRLRKGPGAEINASVTTNPNSLELAVSTGGGLMKSFLISDYYPTGNVDGKGDDIFNAFHSEVTPQSDFSNNFVNITLILANGSEPVFYLNGRKIDETYPASLPDGALLKSEHISTSGVGQFAGYHAGEVIFAEHLSGNIDEVRVWRKALTEKEIRTDFKRYLGGSEPGLTAYMRCDEAAGEYAYDISKIGVEFNRNHGLIRNGSWTDEKPTSSQLGILGVTDALGNYIISAIPYSGTGDSYTITPMLGVHQFQPGQQLIFIGNGSEVTNKVDFRDISSFNFKGRVYYTTDGVFAPLEAVITDPVEEDGYNQYRVSSTGELLSKGTHYYDGETLYETPTIFASGANVYIDGDIVLDKDKRPEMVGVDGSFEIEVPIGRHYIEIRKNNHTFAHGGRFPASRADGDDLFEFFEHQETEVTFLDTTRVALVGRVVGGMPEADKPIGFGYAGAVKETYYPETDSVKTIDISSVNNIGKATITLKYAGLLQKQFSTHEETGEYRVSLLPLTYSIEQSGGIIIENNDDIQLLDAVETLNLSDVKDTIVSQYEDTNGDAVFSTAYHFVKSFTHRSTPVLNVISQSKDLAVSTTNSSGKQDPIAVSTEGFPYPVFTQGGKYDIEFETFEEYINYDGLDILIYRVPIVDGEFNITNNLALPGSENLEVDENDPSLSTYSFRAGFPSISSPFTRTIEIKYRVDGKDYDARNYLSEGIILGGQSDGTQTFVTEAPDMPDIILRDPPGSNSFASIEEGTSLSLVSEASVVGGQSNSLEMRLALGVTFKAGGGMVGPVIESESVNGLTIGLNYSVESTHGTSITKTYSFKETISTSDDPEFVGSEADLYIGNSKNYLYGSYDNVQAGSFRPDSAVFEALVNSTGDSIFISTQKGFYFAEEPSETFFIYSQKHILETLIPELAGIVNAIEQGSVSEETPGVLSKAQYEEQIRLWRYVIQENERTKYDALYGRISYKNRIASSIQAEIDAVDEQMALVEGLHVIGTLTAQDKKESKAILEAKKAALEERLELLEENFYKNISFDAGVGEYINSSERMIAEKKTISTKFQVGGAFETTFGFKLNSAGLVFHTKYDASLSLNSSMERDSVNTTNVVYTLKDSDPNNFLSVDVVNVFDGNGPIFSSVGGRTSCPYEGIDTTLFFNANEYMQDVTVMENPAGAIYSGGEQISYATQKVEVPGISVQVASISDVPEERAAEFKLVLENNSVAGTDANFLLFVDNTTNPNNAIINIEQNGTVVFVPYGQKVEYALTLKKSISDVYEYENIEIVLASLCDGDVIRESVKVSAIFRPSCTGVEIGTPLENWVYNAGDVASPLGVTMLGYNRAFASFEDFNLEYRKSTSSSWTRLHTYYDDAVPQDDSQGTLLSGNTANFSWNIGELGLADGKYELRAVSHCNNGTVFISDIMAGTVDLNIPVQFGTPTPANGILGSGEDLRMQFSENIVHNSALSKIEIKGETNQQEISHNVSIHFEGSGNDLVIQEPNILTGDFAIEFWMNNQSTGSGTLFEQSGALKVVIDRASMDWTFGGQTLSTAIADDQAFHHYTLSYNNGSKLMKVYEDDQELGTLNSATGLFSKSDHPLVIGGNTFIGNLHDLRFWSKSLTLSEAYAAQFNELTGSERDLVGYWPMDEGAGTFASDLARFKHAAIKAEWDIKPKGTAYDFHGGQYLSMDDVSFVQITDKMDITLSFWMKTDQTQKSTIFSNGRGNGDDLIQSNGKANKWAVTLSGGILFLNTEGSEFALSKTNLADNSWHHVAIVLKRTGSLRTYIDAALESSSPVRNIGGISGNKFWIGARGFVESALDEIVDEVFTGKIDELRLWNMARATEQIDRDRFNEVDFNTTGLMLYARMNTPDPVTGNGPQYYRTAGNETILPSNAVMNSGSVSYADDAPPIKQVRPYLNFPVSYVINADEMIITPLVSDWSALEEQVIDITVDRMFDVYGNQQSSPVTWSAFVRRNEVAWFAADNTQNVEIQKEINQPYSFEITLLNKGGKHQPYAIDNIPPWLSAKNTSGTLEPNSSRTIVFTIAPELAIGQYTEDLFLDTDFGFDEKLFLDVSVLGKDPGWQIDASAFENNMNIIGKVKIKGVFPQHSFCKVAAFFGSEIRGVANLEYDEDYNEYFLYLSVFSNQITGEDITFRIWDGSAGKVFHASIDGALFLPFVANEVIGFKSIPAIFENTSFLEQHLVLNKGWTWISMYVEDPDLSDVNDLMSGLSLTSGDLIKSQLHFDLYDAATGWNGTLTTAGGLNTFNMYKFRSGGANNLLLGGNEVDITGWSASISAGWNWLSFPLSNNVSLNEALASYDATEGDVIKNQRAFAIYDTRIGWTGPLSYMIAGQGYMLKSAIAQNLTYPDIFKSQASGRLKHDVYTAVSGWASYEHNMNIVAEITSEEIYDSVWVVDNQGVVRGKAEVSERDGRRLSYITVFGNNTASDDLGFYLGVEEAKARAAEAVRFTSDKVIGTVQRPFLLSLEENAFAVYPNAFDREFYLSVNVTKEQESEIQLMDVTGQVVYELSHLMTPGLNELVLQPHVPKGFYVLTVILDGRRITRKMVKE